MEQHSLPVADQLKLLKKANVNFFEKDRISLNDRGKIIHAYTSYGVFRLNNQQKDIILRTYPLTEFKDGITNYYPFKRYIMICFPTPFQINRKYEK